MPAVVHLSCSHAPPACYSFKMLLSTRPVSKLGQSAHHRSLGKSRSRKHSGFALLLPGPPFGPSRNGSSAQYPCTSVLRPAGFISKHPIPILITFPFTFFLPSSAEFFQHHIYHGLTYIYIFYVSFCLLEYKLNEGWGFVSVDYCISSHYDKYLVHKQYSIK